MIVDALKGAVVANFFAIPSAGLVTALYRFPYPLVEEYLRGVGDVPLAMIGALFYLLFGGCVVLGVAGGVAGAIIHRAVSDRGRANTIIVLVAGVVALGAAITLAVIEEFIGEW